MPMRENPEGKQQVAIELYHRFHAMKTYGKEPESLESITKIFTTDLEEFPAETVLKAIATHAKRCDEFPTVADIHGLIKRGGKPPLKESDIIAIRKKDGEDRTSAEWQMLRDWEAEQQGGWATQPDPARQQADLQENIRLRQKVKELEAENRRLGYLVQEQKQNPPTKPSFDEQSAIDKTVAWLESVGAPQADIDSVRQSHRGGNA